jgi:hypothetical protein
MPKYQTKGVEMVRFLLIAGLLSVLAFANAVQKNIYMWYIQEENLRLQNYTRCITDASTNSATAKEKQTNLQKCEESNIEQELLLKDILQTKLDKIKPAEEDGSNNTVEQRQRERFLFKECISFAQSEEEIAQCYREYSGTPAEPEPETTASADQ